MASENSQNLSIGWNIYGGGGLKTSFVSGLGATYSDVHQTTTSNSTVALNDVNGDRKTDIILSGKNYYLKNTSKNGNVSFKQEMYNNKNCVVVENNVKKLTTSEINEYKEQYKIQTPFRQWKSEYDGIISVSQDISTIGTFDQSNSVKAIVYKGKSTSSVNSLATKVSGTQKANKSTAQLNVEKDESIYFITETDEPLNSDINYNIKIDYTDIKTYKSRLKAPHFFPQKEILRTYNPNSGIAIKDIVSQMMPEEFSSIYKTSTEQRSDGNGSVSNYVVCTLKDAWQKSANKAVYSQLINYGRFLPGAFTEEQFDKILKSFSTKVNTLISKRFFALDKKETLNKKIMYERFTSRFEHDITHNLYVIRDNTEIELLNSIQIRTYQIPLNNVIM